MDFQEALDPGGITSGNGCSHLLEKQGALLKAGASKWPVAPTLIQLGVVA